MNHPEIIIVPVIFFSIAWLIKVLSDNRVKRKLIEKGELNANVENLAKIDTRSNPLSAIKWGLVFIGIGTAILISHLFPYSVSDEMIFALMFMFAGIGFIIYYFIAKTVIKNDPA
jgi:hypothetical protein